MRLEPVIAMAFAKTNKQLYAVRGKGDTCVDLFACCGLSEARAGFAI